MKGTHFFRYGIFTLVVMLVPIAAPAAEEESDQGLIDMVLMLMGENDKDMRGLAFEQIRTEVKGEAATKVFAAELPKLSAESQVGLLSALANRGDATARPAILDLLKATDDASVKVAAVNAVGYLGEPGDSKLLIELLADGSKDEKVAAEASLIRLPGDEVPGLIVDAIKKAPTAQAVKLIEILSTRRAFDTIPYLKEAAVGSDATLRRAAMIALGELGRPEDIAGMIQGVLRAENGREREAAEKCVMFVCERIEDPETRAEPLVAAIDKLKEADQLILLPGLGRVGGAEALKAVEAAIASKNSARHSAGLRALCNWPNASVAPQLIELVKNDPHKGHDITALRALIRIAPLPDGRTDQEKLELLKSAWPLCTRDAERELVLQRASAIRIIESLRFLMPYTDQPTFAEPACLSIVELAHHRELRDSNKEEFHQALDKVIATSKDATVIDRANRYKKGQTWARPK